MRPLRWVVAGHEAIVETIGRSRGFLIKPLLPKAPEYDGMSEMRGASDRPALRGILGHGNQASNHYH
jgi:hypothetical protein